MGAEECVHNTAQFINNALKGRSGILVVLFINILIDLFKTSSAEDFLILYVSETYGAQRWATLVNEHSLMLKSLGTLRIYINY